MTVTPSGVDYALPTNVDTISPLVEPSHSELHNDTNRAVVDINNRLTQVELVMAGLTAPQGTIEQARLAAHTAMVRGPLTSNLVGTMLVPIIWNLTGRAVAFQAAIATLEVEADADVEVDIVLGTAVTGNTYDPAHQTSILKTGKRLLIPAGQHVTPSLAVGDFNGDQPQGSYLGFILKSMGTDALPGGSLTVQINRNL